MVRKTWLVCGRSSECYKKCYNKRCKFRRNFHGWIPVKYTRPAACSKYHGESDHNKPRVCAQAATEGCSNCKKRRRKGRDLAGHELAASERMLLVEEASADRAGDTVDKSITIFILYYFGCLLCNICFSFTKLLGLHHFFLVVMG